MNASMWADKPPHGPEQSAPVSPTHAGLSAAASTFTPEINGPPPDASSVEQFRQTGALPDDLRDDIPPAEESMRIRSDDDLFSDDFTPAAQPVVVSQPQSPAAPNRAVVTSGSDASRARGRGRGRGRGANDGRHASERSDAGEHGRPEAPNARTARPQPVPRLPNAAPENAPSGPRKETRQAVRGDRSAAGGLRQPKLTEEQLAEKMARIQIKNASLAAAHARAEADMASFNEREQQARQMAEQRQKEERRDRRQMMGEREKNRQRKLKAMEGREWDAEKREDDFGHGGRFDQKAGLAGDRERYGDGREYLYHEPRGGGGGRGGAGGRGGGRAHEQAAPRPDEFPALPPRRKTDTTTTTPPDHAIAIGPGGGSWAEQMDSTGP